MLLLDKKYEKKIKEIFKQIDDINQDKNKILIKNLVIIYNNYSNYNEKCIAIKQYLEYLKIKYDNNNLLKIIKKYNYNFYNKYLNVINYIYNEEINTKNISIFDDYLGSNQFTQNTFLYNSILKLLKEYN